VAERDEPRGGLVAAVEAWEDSLVAKLLAGVRRSAAFEVALIVAMALALALSVQAYAVKPYRIPSESMEPTLHVGDRVLVNRISHHLGAEPRVGQIVVFHPPSGADASPPRCGAAGEGENGRTPCSRPTDTASSHTFVKRVVGVAGDRIALRNGRLIRNGSVQREPYARPCGGGPACHLPRPATVPKGHVYLLGDNRGASQDSRFWGPVPISWVIGEAVAIYWPPDRAGAP
jgi:signal peptidase I